MQMKEHWTKDIHDKLSGMEIDEPAGLWDDICAARKQQAETFVVIPRHQHKRWNWVRNIASVAAMVALLFATGIYLFNINEEPKTTTAESNAAPNAVAAESNINNTNTSDVTVADNTSAPDRSVSSYTNPISAPSLASLAKGNDGLASANDVTEEADDRANETEANNKAQSEANNKTHEPEADKQTEEKPTEKLKSLEEYDPFKDMTLAQTSASAHRPRFALALHSNGATGASHRTRYTSAPAASDVSPETSANWGGSPLLGILLLTHGTACETEYKHHLPVRAGISASYALSPRLSLESGITFTRLISDIRDGNDSKYQSGEQKLQYIGIPVSINYELFSWKRLGIYTSAGVLAEQCISGTQKWEYHINNTTTQKDKENIGTKPFQMSVNGSVGIEYRLTPTFDIYAGPGISYHFDDGSFVQTIYKEKPFNFNLNCGIRINLNK